MSSLTFAMITPSFAGDYEQFALLAHTVERHIPETVTHYVLVPRDDYAKFRRFQSKRTRVLIEDEFLPAWAQGLLTVNRYRITTRTLPIRGWILQQMLKLSAPAFAPEDVYLYVDSDVAFLREFRPTEEFVRDGKVRLFCERCDGSWPLPIVQEGQRWRQISCNLLGVQEEAEPQARYIGNIIAWRRDVLMSLQTHLSRGIGRSWQERIARCSTFSEYTLYGVYVENVLGYESAGHYQDSKIYTLDSWQPEEQSVDDLIRLRNTELAPHHVGIMISAKGYTPAERIEQVFDLRAFL
ncbi:MAG: DUF6492 family protein [Cyanobacteria bacterium P01_F01_bin.56]